MSGNVLSTERTLLVAPPKDPFAHATAEESDPDAEMTRDDPAPQDGPGRRLPGER